MIMSCEVPTRFLKIWIQSHYAERVIACWQSEDPNVRRINLTVRSAVIRCAQTQTTKPVPHVNGNNGHCATVVVNPVANGATKEHEMLGGSPLNPRLTFDAFVVRRSNMLAYAAAKQVAANKQGERVMFNPLFIHAGVGLGKTHLLQAIARAGMDSKRQALYLTAEKFMHRLNAALGMRTVPALQKMLWDVDVLLIDDLQFLLGRTAQAELRLTIDTLCNAGRQVVVAAYRPPAELEQLDDRVRSRLAGGLVVEMGQMGEELRLEILNSWVAAARLHHPGFDVPPLVLSYIAKTLTGNGRDLEGALNRLLAHSKLTGQPITFELAEREIRDLIHSQEPRRIKIEEIQRVVSLHYNVSRSDLLSSRRTANIVRPRQVAMYLAKTLTLRSFPEIGRRFGGRDHTTVLHAVRKIDNLVGNDQELAAEVETLKRQLAE